MLAGTDGEQTRKSFRNSPEGISAANKAYALLSTTLEARAAEIAGPGRLRLEVKRQQEYRLIIGLGLFTLVCWRPSFQNLLDDSVLTVDICDGMPRLPGMLVFEEGRRIREIAFDYALLSIEQHGYIQRYQETRSFSPPDLADHLLRIHMDMAQNSAE